MRKIFTSIAAFIVVFFAVICYCSGTASAQTKKDDKPYNLKKAWEVLQEDQDEAQAIKLLTEQLRSTPDNVECWMLLCRIYRNREEFGSALSAVNEAIKVNKPKKSGFFHSTLWWWKGSVYDDLGETGKSVECLRKSLDLARKDNKDNVQSISFELAQGLFELKHLDEADAVYRKILKEDESDAAAMVGLARNMIERGDYQGAIGMLAKAKAKMRTSDNKSQWRVLMLAIYEQAGEYENAIAEYDAMENDYGKDEFIYYHRANCYSQLGLTDNALSEIGAAITLNDYYNSCRKGQILRTAGCFPEAIKAFDRAIEIDPADAFAYYAKGWCYELFGNDPAAMECYEHGIDVDKEYPYIRPDRFGK